MKLTLLLTVIAVINLTAATYSQEKKLDVNLTSATVGKVFKVIEQLSDFSIFYKDNQINTDTEVNLNMKNATVSEILDKTFKNTPLHYTILDKIIVISNQSQAKFKVTGTVVTANSLETLIGVIVREKGTSNATVTDVNGFFTIIVSSPNAKLEFSYVGFEKQEVDVNNISQFTIKLGESVKTLDEVVVVGYGTQKKVTLTGAVSAIRNSDIVITKNENVQNMLAGKVAGLRVVQNSSEPGSFSNSFDIRGLGSPLIIIDGIPRDNMSRLDPNDIESVSVLKDASAAIYGVRAANGVVLITTRKGNSGTLELNYTGNMGWQIPSGLPQGVGALDYMKLTNERSMHNVNGGRLSFTDADMAPYIDGTKQSTDWYSPVIRDMVPQTQQNLSATGGNDRTRYFMSLGHTYQEGFLKSRDLFYNKYNVRLNANSKITNRLTVDMNINGIQDEKNQPYQDAWWIIRSFWRQVPTQPIYANNNPLYLQNTQVDGTNPQALMDKDLTGYKKFNNKWFQSSFTVNYEVPYVKGLVAKGLFSYDYNISENKLYQKKYDQYTYSALTDIYTPVSQQSPSSLERDFYSRTSLLYQLSLNYEHQFNKDHNLNALLLFENSERNGDNFYAKRELSLYVDQLLAGNSLNQVGNMNANDLYRDANMGIVGRVNYSYKSKYLSEFSFRNDGSSKFGNGHQWGFFPSASAGWRISEENFWKKTPLLSSVSNLKIRASYGKMGDDGASRYQFVSGYYYPASGSNNQLPPGSMFDGAFVSSAQSKGLINPSITWYVAKTLDFGVDMEMWKGLLGFTADYFKRDRTGLLATRSLSLPGVVGASLPQENLNGDITQGLELELTHRNSFGDFSYNVKGIFSYTRTKTTYVERSASGNSYENWRQNSNDRLTNIWWGYDGIGQFQSYNAIVTNPFYVGRGTLPGDYGYADWNGDGQISDLDVHPIKTSGQPLMNFGLTLGGSFKGFDMNILLQGAAKVNVSYIEQLREPLWGGGSGLTQFLDRWHPVDPKVDPYDPNIKWESGHFGYTGSMPDVNSIYNIQNGSYIRLKNIELGYTLPNKLSQKVGIKNLRVYVNGYNLLTATKLRYVDPEHPSDTYGYIYPLNKTFSVGLNIKF